MNAKLPSSTELRWENLGLFCRMPVEKLPPAIAIVIDNIGDSYVVITMNELFELYLERMKTSNYDFKSKMTT